jgi:group I intron endonuclease
VIVYLLRNEANGKCYIGQTRHKTLSKRWNRTLTNATTNGHLKAAIRKYGPESFSRSVLAHASCEAEADLLERFFIQTFQTTDRRFGYNFMSGGKAGPGRHIGEVKERIREKVKTAWAKRSEKAKWEFAFAQKLRWLDRAEEERRAISRNITEALLGKPRLVPAWNKGLPGDKGKPSPRKGRKFGPQRSPCTDWPPKTAQHRQHISEGLMKYFQQRGLPPKKPATSVRQPYQGTPESKKKIRAMIALKEMEAARNQVRELQKRLQALDFELKGGCNW